MSVRPSESTAPHGPVPYDGEAVGPGAVEDHPGPLARRQQGRCQSAWVDLMVAVHPQAPAHARREHGFQAPALTAREPLRGQPRALLEGVQLAQLGAVVGVEGDGQGAAGAIAGVLTAGLLELRDEAGVTLGGGEIEPEQCLFAVVEFGDGGEHAGRDPRGPAAGLGVGDGGTQAALCRPPGGDQSDDPASDDEHVGTCARTARTGGARTGFTTGRTGRTGPTGMTGRIGRMSCVR